MGAKVDGYCSDCTRTLATGELTTRRPRATSSCWAPSARRSPRPVRARPAVTWTPSRAGHRRRRARRSLRARAGARRGPRGARGTSARQDREGRAGRRHGMPSSPASTCRASSACGSRISWSWATSSRRSSRGSPRTWSDPRLMLLAALAALVGAAVQSSTGFGFALVLSPALFAVPEPTEAVTTLLALGLALNLLVLFERGRPEHVDRRRLAPMLAAAVPGLAVGVVILGALSKEVLQIGVGLAVITAAAWQLRRRVRGCAWLPRGRGRGLRERGAHHLDQRERSAARALARGARRERGRVPGDAGVELPGAQPRRGSDPARGGGRAAARCGRGCWRDCWCWCSPAACSGRSRSRASTTSASATVVIAAGDLHRRGQHRWRNRFNRTLRSCRRMLK